MEIKTKYDVGDVVWFYNETIDRPCVTNITGIYTSFDPMTHESTEVTYSVTFPDMGHVYGEYLHRTKEEAIEHNDKVD